MNSGCRACWQWSTCEIDCISKNTQATQSTLEPWIADVHICFSQIATFDMFRFLFATLCHGMPRSCCVFCSFKTTSWEMDPWGPANIEQFVKISMWFYILLHTYHIIHLNLHIMCSDVLHNLYHIRLAKVYEFVTIRDWIREAFLVRGVHRWSSFSWSSTKKLPWPALWVTLVPPLGGHGPEAWLPRDVTT